MNFSNTSFIVVRGGIAAMTLLFGIGIAVLGVIGRGGATLHESLLFLVPVLTAAAGGIPVLRGEIRYHPKWVIRMMSASALGVSVSVFWMVLLLTQSMLLAILGGAAAAAFDVVIALPTAPQYKALPTGQSTGLGE